MDAQSEKIFAKLHEEFEIRLISVPSTGYIWQLETCPEQLQLLDTIYEHIEGQPTVGGSMTQIFRFRGTAPGQYEIVFVLKRQWETTSVNQSKFRVTVE